MRLQRRLPLSLSALTLLATVAVAADDNSQNTERSCTAHDGDTFYDLSPLQSSTDYSFRDSGQEFFINVCQPVHHDLWHVEVDRPDNVGAFIRNFARRGDTSIGEVNTTLTVKDGHPLLLLTGGSLCPNTDDMRAMTAIRFICDTSVFGSGTPFLVAQLPPDDELACAFFIEWRTHYACPAAERTGFWGGLILTLSILAIILMMLYFVGGTLYRRYVLNIRGFDQLPRFSLFSLGDTIEFVQNVCDRFITSSRSQSWTNDYNHHTSYQSGRRQRGSVDRLPTLPEEEESLIAGDHENDHIHAEGRRAPPPQQVQPTPAPQTQVQQGTPDPGLGHANDGDAQPHPMDTQNVIRS